MNEIQELGYFKFENHFVRTITGECGEPWFVAKDVCEVLEHSNPSVALLSLDMDERAKVSLGRQGEANIINESCLYILILRSNKPQAKPFRKWVTSEVLPAIRKTGSYTAGKAQQPKSLAPIAKEYRALVWKTEGGQHL